VRAAREAKVFGILARYFSGTLLGVLDVCHVTSFFHWAKGL